MLQGECPMRNMNKIILQSDTILNSFIETVVPEIRKYFNPSKILIFGSRVSGEATENSDIDVIIVSDFFRGIKFVKRMADVLRKIKFSRHIDFICYTPEEFEKIQHSSTVVKAALLEGIFA
jgi:predicted nucleotidyltransferase